MPVTSALVDFGSKLKLPDDLHVEDAATPESFHAFTCVESPKASRRSAGGELPRLQLVGSDPRKVTHTLIVSSRVSNGLEHG